MRRPAGGLNPRPAAREGAEASSAVARRGKFSGSLVGRRETKVNGRSADETLGPNRNPQHGLDSNQVHIGSVAEPGEADLSFLSFIDAPVRAKA